jgi:hypothetical protein
MAPVQLRATTLANASFNANALRLFPSNLRAFVQLELQALNGDTRTTLARFAGVDGTLVDALVLTSTDGKLEGQFGTMLYSTMAKLAEEPTDDASTPAAPQPEAMRSIPAQGGDLTNLGTPPGTSDTQ